MAADAPKLTRKLVRTAVLKTNRYAAFRAVNRLPYHFAVRAVRAAMRKLPEVRSVVLRSGFASGEWVPGLSDIDFIAILRAGLGIGREYAAVSSLRASYRQLQRAYPMLGELVVLGEDDFESWFGYSASTPGKPQLATLQGVPLAIPESGPTAIWRQNALNTALCIFLDFLPPCLSQPPGFLREQDIARRVRKIARLAAPLIGDDGALASVELAGAAKILEMAVASAEAHTAPDPPDPGWFPHESNRSRFVDSAPAGVPGLHCVLDFGGRTLLVVEDGLSPARLKEIADGSERFGPRALVASRSVLRYAVNRYNPHDYGALFENRTILRGADPLAGMDAPGKAAFAAYVRGRAAGIIAFLRGEEIFGASFSLPEFEAEVERAMQLRLCLGSNWVAPYRRETARRWRTEFPDDAQSLHRIRQCAQDGSPGEARQAAFFFFQSLQAGVRRLLEISDEPVSYGLSRSAGL